MNVLVYGAFGWIGQQFISLLDKNNIDYRIGSERCDNLETLKTEIILINPTHIISFIGRTHGTIGDNVYTTIDYLEQKGKLYENIRDNLYSPLVLANISKELSIHYTYLGTGCIFKYDDEHLCEENNGFKEHSEPNFFGSSYSIAKGFTDKIMRNMYDSTALNLRIRMPITGEYNPRNFITKITTYDKICSIPNSMTVLPALLPKVIKMMEQKLTGTINLTNPGLISHNEILEMYKEIVDPKFIWKNFTEEEQRKILESDRSNNYLETSKLEYLFHDVLHIKDAVRNCLTEYKKTMPICIKQKSNLYDIKEGKMNLLITGGCGFIGSNFINHYFYSDNVNLLVNFDALYYCADENNVEEPIRSSDNYIMIKGNLCDMNKVRDTIEKYNITHVIHFAAQSHVQNSFEDSINFTYDNVLGTHTLLEVCRKYGKIIRFIHVSTDEVYGESMLKDDEAHKTEQSVLCPSNPYAATKAGAELIAQSYYHSFKMPIIITRGNNVYGPNQYPEKLIPRFIKLLKEDKKVTIQGDGSNVRAFLHAYDAARAFECVLERGEIGEIYNIGCDEGMEYSVINVAKMLIKLIKNTDDYNEWIEYVEDRPFNDKRYYISNEKVKMLGWEIKVNFEEGITRMINKKFPEKKLNCKMLEYINKTNVFDFFGDWINDENIIHKFLNAEPFEHVIISNFLNKEYAETIAEKFPTDYEGWHKYCNPLEVKYAYDNINMLDENIQKLFYLMSSDKMINKISNISGIKNITYDDYLHGAGLHAHPRYGRLNMHLDYEKHPYSGMQRRLNVILYMNKEWDSSWNGATELWDKNMEKCVAKSEVKFNTAIIFKTNEISWHGVPEIIMCPENIFRKTIAYYYVSPLESMAITDKVGNDGSGYRTKATFVKRPQDIEDERINKLHKIRPYRRIECNDMTKIWYDWKLDKN